MYVYHEVGTVQAYATTTANRLAVRIPLRGADRVMTLFKSLPLPSYSDVSGRHVQVEPEAPYIAVTENRQYYSLLTTIDLQQCTKRLFSTRICEATFPFTHKTRATCALTLYFGKTDFAHKFCRKVILNENFNPASLQAKGIRPFWIYSLPSPVTVSKECKLYGTTHILNIQLSSRHFERRY
jgi:hypothetical protein